MWKVTDESSAVEDDRQSKIRDDSPFNENIPLIFWVFFLEVGRNCSALQLLSVLT